MGSKLQRCLYGFESVPPIEERGHFKILRSLDRELKLTILMHIVEPGTDDIAINHFRQLVHHITSSSFTIVRQREGSEYISGFILAKHLGSQCICLIGHFTDAVIVRSYCFAIKFIQNSTREVTGYIPSLLGVWPELDGFCAAELPVV